MDNSYLSLTYNSKERWLSYWYQISETLEVSPANVLVIGKGSGITETAINLLSSNKVKVITLDNNYSVNSDVAGDVTSLPFVNDSFDVAVCCQVLEHIPFGDLPAALYELHRVARKRTVISLPHKRKYLKIVWKVPFLEEKTLIVKHPFTVKHCSSKQHYWEIGRGVSRKQILKVLTRFFEIEKEFLNEINCEHRFFILKRKTL